MATSLSHPSLSSISHISRTSSSSTSSPSHLHFPSSSSIPPLRLSSSRRPLLPPVSASADSPSSTSPPPPSTSPPPPSLESQTEPAASAAGDSVVAEVASLPEAGDTEGVAGRRRGSPLERGGTLKGEGKEGKDPSASTLGKSSLSAFAAVGEKFEDPRWKNGTWDVAMFAKDGKVNWDAVIDAEVLRRKWLEENPVSSTNEDPVVFDTSIVPWWAWVRRFHLPEAEKLNGRAAMVGYALGYLVDAATGVGLVDQSNGFIGKLLILVSVLGILVIRKTEDVQTIKDLAQEWTFYDKQWQATWKEGPPRGGEEVEKKN